MCEANTSGERWTNERGFTLIGLMVGSGLSLVLIAMLVTVFQSQKESFILQNELNKMQANGRAAVNYITRGVQNSGFNVVRGTRFLAASDHYLTSVFDEDNDGVIEADEVFTYALSNSTGASTETFTISPFFDMDSDGAISSAETRDYSIGLTLGTPDFNLYMIKPNVGDSGSERSKLAEHIDNLIIRYYDKNDDPLPSGVTVDADGRPVPPYTLASSDMNDIRRLEIEVLVKSPNQDPRDEYLDSGAYTTGSAATVGGTTTYSDRHHRLTFESNASPRNLVMAPYGIMSIAASPNPVECPDDTTTVTATLLDSEGAAVGSGLTVNFNASDGTVGASSSTTNGSGEASTTLSYDWAAPNASITLSANSLITVGGSDFPVFNAIPVSFESGDGILTDNFDDGDSAGWTELGSVNWNVASQKYKTASNGSGQSLNGCASWQDYVAQVDLMRNGSLGLNEYAGLVLRYQDTTHQYQARILCLACAGNPAGHVYVLQLILLDTTESIMSMLGFTGTVLDQAVVVVTSGDYYTIKASVEGDALKAKIWLATDPEPASWDLEVTDSTYTEGKVGLMTTKNVMNFDNVSVNPITP
ncbi:MAG: hypothetical protein G3M78_03460 [Candidatus Nitrohelix vancouverensis]|uniref:Cadherin domain-containing protein n=1 Tax=Candidatus Nitrohelix vancouverensis TaxID=2705534 RepID=A0A7T0G2N8_9BACT|nr:MAG: hypothetical protein G3M78_03460 [Candidatus Nitrohelix vancouverensis]